MNGAAPSPDAMLLERSVCTQIGHIEETKRQHHKKSSTVESSRTTEDRQTKEQLEKRSRATDRQQNNIISGTVQPTNIHTVGQYVNDTWTV